MKKYNHPIDDFFREALEDHQMAPSDAARKAFLGDVMQAVAPDKKGRKGLFLLSAALLLIATGISIWAVTSDKTSSKPLKGPEPSVEHTLSADQKDIHAVNPVPDNKIQQHKTEPIIVSPNKQPDRQQVVQKPARQPASGQTAAGQHSGKQPARMSLPSPLPAPGNKPDPLEISPADGINQVNEGSNDQVTAQTTIPGSSPEPDAAPAPMILKTDSVPAPAAATKEKSPDTPGRHSNWIPSIGAYYTPEWMFNTLEGTKFVNNFGIEGTFHFGRFSLRTGAGLSIAKGTNELVVEYNDYLGTYNNLDSMEFTWNGPAHTFTPTMYMSQKEVWDSLMKLDYAKVVKRYTYLQIPLVMGYDFWQSDRVSVGVRVGPVLSILVNSKQLSAPYDPGNKRIISINDIAPEQVSLNWQAMAGISASFRLTEALNIEIEPCARYYFNSVYEKPVNNAKPWSIGMRAAFVVKL